MALFYILFSSLPRPLNVNQNSPLFGSAVVGGQFPLAPTHTHILWHGAKIEWLSIKGKKCPERATYFFAM